MTGMLPDLLRDKARGVPPPELDVDAIVRAGDRRIRRRRGVTALAAAVVLGVVAFGAITVPPLDDGGPQPAEAPFSERLVSWAEGSTIHWGERSLDVGQHVASYVQTDNGFVWTSRDGTVWFFDGGSSVRLGTAHDHRLWADDQGSLVSWVEPGRDSTGRWVVHDTGTGKIVGEGDRELWTDPKVIGYHGMPTALDDGSLYLLEDRRVERYDVGSARREVLWRDPELTPGERVTEPMSPTLFDAAAGQLAYGFLGSGISVARSIDPEAPTLGEGYPAALSPTGAHVALGQATRPRGEQGGWGSSVVDSRTGEDVTPDLDSYAANVVYAWVDDSTLMALGLKEYDADRGFPVDVLTCDVGGDCAVVAATQLGRPSPAGQAAGSRINVPVGKPSENALVGLLRGWRRLSSDAG